MTAAQSKRDLHSSDIRRSEVLEEEQSVDASSSEDEEKSLIVSIRKHYSSSKKRHTHFPSTLRCYQVQSIVGKGAFGKVALAIQRLTGKPVAIKMIEKTTL